VPLDVDLIPFISLQAGHFDSKVHALNPREIPPMRGHYSTTSDLFQRNAIKVDLIRLDNNQLTPRGRGRGRVRGRGTASRGGSARGGHLILSRGAVGEWRCGSRARPSRGSPTAIRGGRVEGDHPVLAGGRNPFKGSTNATAQNLE